MLECCSFFPIYEADATSSFGNNCFQYLKALLHRMVDQRHAVAIHNIEDENWYESGFRNSIAEIANQS